MLACRPFRALSPLVLALAAVMADAHRADAQTVLNGGTVPVDSNAEFGTDSVSFIGSTTLQFNGSFTLDNVMSIASGVVATMNTQANVDTLNGDISGGGALTKMGTGTLILGGANTYSGGTNVDAGLLAVTGSLAQDSEVNVAAGATFVISTSTASAFSGTINLANQGWDSSYGTFAKSGAGTLTIDGATISGGEAYVLEGTIAQTSGATSVNYLAVGTGSGGTGTLDVSGGVLTIGSAMQIGDFGGQGAVNQTGGTVRVLAGCGDASHCASLNVGNQGGSGTYDISGGTLELNGGLHNIGHSEGSQPASDGTLNISGDGLVWVRPATDPAFGVGRLIVGSRTPTTDPGGQGTGTINQTGGVLRVENGSELLLSGYGDGTYNLMGGVLQVGGTSLNAHYGGGAATGTYTFNFGGGAIQAYGTALTASLDANLVSGTTSTIDTNGLGVTWSGDLSGGGALAKVGAGALVLSGANSYAGGTQLSAGTLVAGNSAALGTGALSFNAASTLQFGGNFALANAVDIAPGVVATIDSNGNAAAALNGVVAGGGVLNKAGAGTLVLGAANTYTGGTQVSGGTLQLGPGGGLAASGALLVGAGAVFDLNGHTQTIGTLSGAGNVLLGAGALTSNSAGDAAFSGAISGGGSFTKAGGGTLLLTGASTYAGPTAINGGMLIVNGSLVSEVTVNAGTLGGAGSIGGLVVQGGGTVAPGNSIGTLGVNGGVNFQPQSTYAVEVGTGGQADLIQATGAATINGGTVALQRVAPITLDTRYTILSAAGGRTGQFATLTSDLAFLAPTLGYDATDVFLIFARNSVDFEAVARTRNERAVARALDQFPSDNTIFSTVLGGSAADARQAFDALSGEVHASTAGILVMDSVYVRDAVFGRLIQATYSGAGGSSSQSAALAASGPTTVAVLDQGSRMSLGFGGLDDAEAAVRAIPSSAHGLAFWTRGFGAWGGLGSDGNAASTDRSLGGFVSGVDGGVGGGWRAGLATGYIRSELSINARASSSDIDSYVLAGYAGGPAGPFAVRSGGAWTWHDVDATRSVVFPGFFERESAKYNADTGQLFGELAYPLSYAGVAVEPFSNLAYVHVGTDGFTESGALAGLTSGGADHDVGVSRLGVRAGTTLPVYGMTLTPYGSLAWQYAFGDVTPEQAFAFASTGIGFGIAGVPIAESSALVEAGLDLDLSPDARLGVSYSGQFGEDMHDNSVQGRLNWRF